jgi:hypothetical protein
MSSPKADFIRLVSVQVKVPLLQRYPESLHNPTFRRDHLGNVPGNNAGNPNTTVLTPKLQSE